MRTRHAVIAAGLIAACHHAPSSSSSSPPQSPRGRASRPSAGSGSSATRSATGPIVGDYDITYDGKGELRVEARFAVPLGGEGWFSIESGVEGFLRDFQFSGAGGGGFQAGHSDGRMYLAPPCATAKDGCRLRYRIQLRAAAKRIDDLDVASEEGQVIEAPPSTWILTPQNTDPNARIRFHVHTPDGSNTSFVTGVFHSRGPDGKAIEDAWDVAVGDLWTAPYSAFGPLHVETLHPANSPETRINMAIAPGKMLITTEQLTSFVTDASRAITTYYGGRFPIPEVLVLFVPSRGRWVGEGKTLSGGGGAIFMRIGEVAPISALKEDWVLVHEMTHLTFPSVARQHDWAEEGLATYVEPFARARAGTYSVESAWSSLIEGLPNGLPKQGDRGLDQTPTWGRTYWGGALFYLLADVEIRKRTQNRFGLEHALRAILEAGGNNAHRWELDDAYEIGDKATGVPVLRELHAAMGTSPHPVDLDAIWKDLGISAVRGAIHFDDKAPNAAIRKAMTTP